MRVRERERERKNMIDDRYDMILRLEDHNKFQVLLCINFII